MTTVHRLLDDAFAGVEPTAEVQDLKEEIRANLTARATELESSGVAPADAARRAVDELGDVRAVITEAAGLAPAGPGSAATTAPPASPSYGSMAQAALANKVRPRPGFVVGVVLAGITVAASLITVMVAMRGGPALPFAGAEVVLVAVAALAAGWIVGSALAQETTTNHPVPRGRAALFGVAAACCALGVGLTALGVTGLAAGGVFVVAGLAVVVGVTLFAWLGATQTNRKKAWARQVAWEHGEPGDRFSRDPEAAARFGILTAVIWVSAFVGFVVIGLAAGWAWSWLTFVVGWIAFMLLLAKMLFGGTER